MLLRFAPGNMREEDSGSRLTTNTAFSIDKIENMYNYESGLSATLGFDYKTKIQKKKMNLIFQWHK